MSDVAVLVSAIHGLIAHAKEVVEKSGVSTVGISLGIGDPQVDALASLPGARESISVYEPGHAHADRPYVIEAVHVDCGRVSVRAQRESRPATPEEIEHLERSGTNDGRRSCSYDAPADQEAA